MKSSMKKFAIAFGIGLTTASMGNAQTKERTVTRLFWQDASDQSLKTGDLKRGETWKLDPTTVAGFPQLDADKQSQVTVGRSTNPELCMIDAASPKPTLMKLALDVAEANTITTPVAVQSRTGERFALLFEESRSGEQTEKLHVVALDPNRDGSYEDAALKSSLTIGRSLIEGHSGHHEATAISRSFVAISNPGDGTISIVSTRDWIVQTTLRVGGTPTRILAVGG